MCSTCVEEGLMTQEQLDSGDVPPVVAEILGKGDPKEILKRIVLGASLNDPERAMNANAEFIRLMELGGWGIAIVTNDTGQVALAWARVDGTDGAIVIAVLPEDVAEKFHGTTDTDTGG